MIQNARLRTVLFAFAVCTALAVPAVALAQEPTLPVEVPSQPERAPLQDTPAVIQDPADPEAVETDVLPAETVAAPVIDPIPAVWAPVPFDENRRTAYGLYLAGRLALGRGEGAVGADYLAEAVALTPEQPRLREQAFTAALLSGDLDFAAQVRPTGDAVQPVIGEVGRLVEATQLFAADDADEALALLAAQPIQPPHARAGVYLQPWIAAAAGDETAALVLPTAGASDPTSLFMRHHRALILEHLRRYEEADADFKLIVAAPFGSGLFRQSYGEFLERRGRRDEAVAVYDAAIAAGLDAASLRAGRARAVSGGRAPVAPTLKEGAAGALLVAALQIEAEGSTEFAAVYLRLALSLDRQDATVLRLGQTLAEAGIEAGARDILAGIGPADAKIYAQSRLDIGRSLARDGQSEAALAQFRLAAQAAPAEPAAAYLIAAQLTELGRHAEALTVLNGPLLNTGQQNVDVRFLRGAAYESNGQIPEAEAELWAALQAQPENPSVLNYLGYLWVDSGTRVSEGAALIARAHAAQPDDGNIQDSLGWAQYRQGQYETAVTTLEEAVAKEPANAEINDHLGDAYWQVGRQREAGFQWTRVLTLDPDAERRQAVERKLVAGLAPATPVTGSQP